MDCGPFVVNKMAPCAKEVTIHYPTISRWQWVEPPLVGVEGTRQGTDSTFRLVTLQVRIGNRTEPNISILIML